MFQKLGVILNLIVLLTLGSIAIGAVAQDDKNIAPLQQSTIKQSDITLRLKDTKHLPNTLKSNKATAKRNVIIGSSVIDEEASPFSLDCSPPKPDMLNLKADNPYTNNTNQQIYYLNNKDRIKLERLDKANTLEKSLGKPMKYDNLNHLPFYINPKGITISPLELLRD